MHAPHIVRPSDNTATVTTSDMTPTRAALLTPGGRFYAGTAWDADEQRRLATYAYPSKRTAPVPGFAVLLVRDQHEAGPRDFLEPRTLCGGSACRRPTIVVSLSRALFDASRTSRDPFTELREWPAHEHLPAEAAWAVVQSPVADAVSRHDAGNPVDWDDVAADLRTVVAMHLPEWDADEDNAALVPALTPLAVHLLRVAWETARTAPGVQCDLEFRRFLREGSVCAMHDVRIAQMAWTAV